MAKQPDGLVLELLRGLATDVRDLRADVGSLKNDIREVRGDIVTGAGLKGDLNALRADIASGLLKMKNETREQIDGLRHTLIEYRSVVVGQAQISDLKDRVRRIEQHLQLPPLRAV
jgi:hypothetical protein